jgi:hypothetical protein
VTDLSNPIVWTTKGNLNECDCEIYIEWVRNDDEVIFIKHWFHQGEEVKREPHVLKLKGCESVAESAPAP